jgi:hypothetical protein
MPPRDRAGRVLRLAAATTLILTGVAHAWNVDGVALVTAPGQQVEPGATENGSGGILFAWTDLRSPLSAVYVLSVGPGGGCEPGYPANGQRVTPTSAGQFSPAIVSDGAGGAIVAWEDNRNYPNSGMDIYAQHLAADGSLAPGWPADGLPLCRVPEFQGPPLMCTDGSGGAFVAWQDGRSGGENSVVVIRVAGNGTIPNGWFEGGSALGSGNWHEGDPRIVPDGAGGVMVVWSDWRMFGLTAPDIWGAHLDAAGGLLSGPICTAIEAQSLPALARDGTGRFLVAWQDARAGAGQDDIYALRMDANRDPAPGWVQGGTVVCVSPNVQYGPRIVADGAGGALIAWSDDDGPNIAIPEVRMQHLDGTGARVAGWPAGGLMTHAASYGSTLRGLIADGAGGAILAAEDAGGSGGLQTDVYADHVTAGGVRDWGPAPVCTESHTQQGSVMVGDGAGGAILVWQDLRNTPPQLFEYDLYAQRVLAGGSVLAVTPGPASGEAFALAGARPNPAGRDLAVGFALPDGAPARLELFDLAGRQVRAREVGGLGAGPHVVRLGGGEAVPAGLYWLRLERGGRVLTSRVAVLR